MLPWNSPLRNAMLLAVLGACFVLATVASVFVGGADEASGPVERLATASPQVDMDAQAIFALRPHRLENTATPVRAPSLKEILDSAVVLVAARLLEPPPGVLISGVAPAVATPTETPAPVRQHIAPAPTATPTLPPPPPPAPTRPAPPPPPNPAPPPPNSTSSEDAGYTTAVWDAVNAMRTTRGLPALRRDPALEGAARSYAHTLAAARWFSHTGPDGSTMGQRLAAAGVTTAAGEVLAMGTNGWPAQSVAQAWLDSPPHREQILGAYSRAGVACAFSVENGAQTVRCVMELAA